MHEILTLQLGELSNYLATHFWNAQEAYFTYGAEDGGGTATSSSTSPAPVDHDILWRQGLAADGTETFLPRTVIYDFKANFGPMAKVSPLYQLPDDENAIVDTWAKNRHHPTTASSSTKSSSHGGPGVDVQRQTPVPASAYHQALDGVEEKPGWWQAASEAERQKTIRFWSDYSRVYYHPRSIVALDPLDSEDPTSHAAAFASWEQGSDAFQQLDREHDLLDRDIRRFAEECDLLQGFQVLGGLVDGWAGFSARYLERLRDEYGKNSIWFWSSQSEPTSTKTDGQQQPLTRIERHKLLANKAQTLTETWTQADVVLPLVHPSLHHHHNHPRPSLWSLAASYSVAFESASLPSRLRHTRLSSTEVRPLRLYDQALYLNPQGRRTLTRLQLEALRTVPEPLRSETRAKYAREHPLTPVPVDKPVDPDQSLAYDFFQLDSPSILPPSKKRTEDEESSFYRRIHSQRGFDQEEEAHLSRTMQDTNLQSSDLMRTWCPLPYQLLDSFPSHSTYRHQAAGLEALQPEALSVDTLLSTDSRISSGVAALRKELASVHAGLVGAGLEGLQDSLAEMESEYREAWWSGSDDDDD